MTILVSSDIIAECGRDRVKRVCYVSKDSMEMPLFGCYNVFKDNLWRVNGLWLMEDDLCLFQILSVNQMNMIKSLH